MIKTHSQINTEVSLYIEELKAEGRKFCSNSFEADEVVMIVLEYFLTKDSEYIENMYAKDGIVGCLGYIKSAIRIQGTSARSKYNYKGVKIKNKRVNIYNESNENILNNIPNDIESNISRENLDLLEDILDNDIDWYYAQLFKLNKFDRISLSEISKQTGIGRNTIFLAVRSAIKQIKIAIYNREEEARKLDDYLTKADYNNLKTNRNE
ncbi:sigma-70 family RNA polymerase sigma factor [uncultured Mediterranean phage uvDeep-CGR2-KM19-C269]|nr:sigma-70 family RNA polymerase sigma factor [uncultured Mediterranean phage uvDeep-CGR2-KM19-C269]